MQSVPELTQPPAIFAAHIAGLPDTIRGEAAAMICWAVDPSWGYRLAEVENKSFIFAMFAPKDNETYQPKEAVGLNLVLASYEMSLHERLDEDTWDTEEAYLKSFRDAVGQRGVLSLDLRRAHWKRAFDSFRSLRESVLSIESLHKWRQHISRACHPTSLT